MKKIRLPPPLFFRRNIPFYHEKTATEFKTDKYENYAEIVTRQIRLHLASNAWESYDFQPVLDWVFTEIAEASPATILDIGCGVGRLIGELAHRFSTAECYGIDYSYQLLRQAQDFWVAEKTLDLQDPDRGFFSEKITRKRLPNIHFALAKGEALPFENNSFDLVVSSFTFDRFNQPKKALEEILRILKNDGTALIISPLNFQKKAHWAHFFPIKKLLKVVTEIGFRVEKVDTDLQIKEQLDFRGNTICWECVGLCLLKKG